MKAKEYLLQLKKKDKLIENMLVEREQWKAIATSVTQHITADRVQSSGNQQKMADAVLKLVEIDKEIDEAIDNYVDSRREIIATITKLHNINETYYDVLHKVYIQNMTLNEVADLYGQERAWADKTHGRGLELVQRIINERERNERSTKK